MAFQKPSQGSNIQWANLMLSRSTKNPEIPYPNLIIDGEYLNQPGERGGFNITGTITHVGHSLVEDYNQRERMKATGQKEDPKAHRIFVILDNAYGFAWNAVGSNNVPDNRMLTFVSALAELAENPEWGGIDQPIQIRFYEKKGKDGNIYSENVVCLSTGVDEEGKPLFDDPSNFVRSELPPLAKNKEIDGQPILDNNGRPIKDYDEVLKWLGDKIAVILDQYDKDVDTDTANAQHDVIEEEEQIAAQQAVATDAQAEQPAARQRFRVGS